MDSVYYTRFSTVRGSERAYTKGIQKRQLHLMPDRLIDSWLAAELANGLTKTEAVAALSRACGITYSLSRVGEWKNEIRPVPTKARLHMIQAALPLILEEAGINVKRLTPEQLRKLADALA